MEALRKFSRFGTAAIAHLVVSRTIMLAARRKRVVLAVLLAALCFAAATLVVPFLSPIRVFDKRFHVIGFGTARGTNQAVYLGNELGGRIRDGLIKVGLRLKPPMKVMFIVGADDPSTFISVVYNGKLKQEELEAVQAEVVNGDGKVFGLYPLRDPIQRVGSNYWGAWLFNFNARHRRATNSTGYTLRLRLPDGAKLAEMKLGNQQR